MPGQPRSIASLTISFGLVAIPVKLYSAIVPSERVSFSLVRARDGSRVKQQYIAVNDGKVVERTEMAKGYEVAKDQYVIFSADELKALEEATTRSIDITQFVPLDSVDPVYFDASYYLAADKGGAKPYALLVTALRRTGQCGIGRWVTRGKEHVIVIRPVGAGLAMHQLHFAAEVRQITDVGIDPQRVSDAEIGLAQQLIAQLSANRFDPLEYRDEFKGRIDSAVQRKIAGKEVSLAEAPVGKTNGSVIDLMAALKASLEPRSGNASRMDRKPPKRARHTAAHRVTAHSRSNP